MRRRILVLITLLAPIACSQPQASADDRPAPKPPGAQAPAQLEKLTTPARVVATYLDLHKALAADAAHQTKDRFTAVLNAVREKSAVTDEALRKRLTDAAQAGSAAKDIEQARRAFDTLSKAMLDWLRSEPNPAAHALHVAYCPMAFDTGASWLQQSDKVENPYYGSEMFTCGTIKGKVSPGTKLPPR